VIGVVGRDRFSTTPSWRDDLPFKLLNLTLAGLAASNNRRSRPEVVDDDGPLPSNEIPAVILGKAV
jgi:hypothetical protein